MADLKPTVSIIVPVYHDWERLSRCLDALSGQTYPQERFEVVVVNNDPTDTPPSGFSTPDNVRIVEEPAAGSYAARNCGIKDTCGDILGFTDSDCVPKDDWIENAVQVLNDGADRVAGRIQLFFQGDRLTVAEGYEKVFAFPQEAKVLLSQTCMTANMFAWRNAFRTAGLFDASLRSGGDAEWGWRAAAKGLDIVYRDDVVVQHPARHSATEILRKRRRVMGGCWRIAMNCGTGKREWLGEQNFRPPLRETLRKIMTTRDMSIALRISVVVLGYGLWLDSVWYRLALCSGVVEPPRS